MGGKRLQDGRKVFAGCETLARASKCGVMMAAFVTVDEIRLGFLLVVTAEISIVLTTSPPFL